MRDKGLEFGAAGWAVAPWLRCQCPDDALEATGVQATERGTSRPPIRVLTAGIALFAACPAFIAVGWAQVPQDHPASPEVVQRPLSRVAWALEHRYATVVTYEDPVLLSRDDMYAAPGDENPRLFGAGFGLFFLPADLTPQKTPKLTAAALGEAVDLYHQLNPSGPRFRVLETHYGLHIVPDSVRDQTGARAPSRPVLDTPITVPVGLRTASGHLNAFRDAVAAASGIRVLLNAEVFDEDYAYGGLVPHQAVTLLGTDEEKRPYSFEWGVPAPVPARDALISLLEGSATTLKWYVWYSPAPRPEDRSFLLGIDAMSVEVAGEDGKVHLKRLRYDRCTKCPPLPQPMPPLPPGRRPQ